MISLSRISPEIAQKLIRLLQEDDSLVKEIGAGVPDSREEFLTKTLDWQQNQAYCFAIMVDEIPIGLASISHCQGGKARCGFWYGSRFWGVGIGPEIFHQLRKKAENMGISTLRSTVSARPTIFDFDWMDGVKETQPAYSDKN